MYEDDNSPLPEDDKEYDELWDDADEGDSLDSGEPAPATPDDKTDDQSPAPAEETAAEPQGSDSEVEQLKHKLKSAEGRFTKFEEHIDELRTRIAKTEQPDEQPDPEPELTLPEGWTGDDWIDFSEDNPVQAELLQNQSREVQQLKETVASSEQQRIQKDANESFKTEITSSHPDYEELLANKRDDILTFINSTDSSLLKSAYQQTYERGSATEIVSLMTDYKAARAKPNPGKVNEDRRLNDAMAVPSRSSHPRTDGQSGVPDKDDYDGAWDYFPDDSID